MSDTTTIDRVDELQPIRELCDGDVSFRTEGWRRLIHMEGLRLLVGPTAHVVDAVLCLNHGETNPTYPTKLYLALNLGAGLNWNESAYILGRNWLTFSWRDVRADQPHVAILAAHLAPLNRGRP
jgi:hypothetical protein